MKEFSKIKIFDLQTGAKINSNENLISTMRTQIQDDNDCSFFMMFDCNLVSRILEFTSRIRFKEENAKKSFQEIMKEIELIYLLSVNRFDIWTYSAELETAYNKNSSTIDFKIFQDTEYKINTYRKGFISAPKASSEQIKNAETLINTYLNSSYLVLLKIVLIAQKELSYIGKMKALYDFLDNTLGWYMGYEIQIGAEAFCVGERGENNLKKIIKDFNKIMSGSIEIEEVKKRLINASWDLAHLRFAHRLRFGRDPIYKKKPYIFFATADKAFADLIDVMQMKAVFTESNLPIVSVMEISKVNSCIKNNYDEINKLQIEAGLNVAKRLQKDISIHASEKINNLILEFENEYCEFRSSFIALK